MGCSHTIVWSDLVTAYMKGVGNKRAFGVKMCFGENPFKVYEVIFGPRGSKFSYFDNVTLYYDHLLMNIYLRNS